HDGAGHPGRFFHNRSPSLLAGGGREPPEEVLGGLTPPARQRRGYFVLAGRGRILFRTGFFGGGITSVVPPLAVIFSAADFEKWCALTSSFLVSSPLPRMRIPSAGPFASPVRRRASRSTTSPSLKAASRSPTLTMR